jgi:cobalt-zinc-cadmium resistance protein CzcA
VRRGLTSSNRPASLLMLGKLVELSIRARYFMLVLLVALLGGGVYAALRLPIDAVPDTSTIQVSVMTEAQGMSSLEVERTVTFPIENALNGVPGMVELRSVSRAGISAVTVVFNDSMDPWFVRQLVLERIRGVGEELPPGAGTPELAPLSTGLGEIFQFAVTSDQHSPMQLRTILDWEIVPKLRNIPGIVEVNTMGGQLKEFHVVADPRRLQNHRLSIADLEDALRGANVNVGGGYVERGAEAFTLRGVGLLRSQEEIGKVVVALDASNAPILVEHVADVKVGFALPKGVVTRDGDDAVIGIVMMLLGSNSRDVIFAVKARVAEIQAELPPGMKIEAFYDRSDFVERTVATVMRNLAEGAIVVFIVLAIMLGSIRGAIVVVLGIPGSMAIAMFGMHLTGTTGDLMSLGAIDFGFLVDGPVVMLEAVIAGYAGRKLTKDQRIAAYGGTLGAVARPVAFAVAIIMLVYIPLLALEGVEGKMFRPMATTMAFALLGALIYSVFFFPALVVMFVPPVKHAHGILGRMEDAFGLALPWAIRWRYRLAGIASFGVVGSFILMMQNGADFVPRIDEGDLNVAIRRPPSIGLMQAKALDVQAHAVLARFPEVVTSVALTGRAEVAVDPVGLDNTDIIVHLKPHDEWVTAHDLDGLSVVLKSTLEAEVPSTFVSISQPIEDRTNEMISGSRADVQIMLFGSDLYELKRLSEEVGEVVKDVPGTGDVRVERLLGAPELSVTIDRAALARYGVRAEDALKVIEAARVGVDLGSIYEEQRRVTLRLLTPPRNTSPDALGDLVVQAQDGHLVPLSEVASIVESEGPAQVRRENRTRTVRVEVNLRGRDLVSWVGEARTKVDEAVPLPSGYRIQWGGQFENFERASKRLAVVATLSLAIIFAMLGMMFGDIRYALAVFLTIPFALTGGALGLWIRGLNFSIPAAVGFIALAGVSVLNGVVMAADMKDRIAAGEANESAIIHGAQHTMRAVLTTAAVAALGFLPMALAHGAGAEVQRPLATVVVFGIGLAAILTLFLLPGMIRVVLGSGDAAGKAGAVGGAHGGARHPSDDHAGAHVGGAPVVEAARPSPDASPDAE